MENLILGLVGAGILVFVAICFLWSYVRWRRNTGIMVRYHGTPGTTLPKGTRVRWTSGAQWTTVRKAKIGPEGFVDVVARRS